MPESKEVPDWTYEHPSDHPDNKEPVTVVAVPSDEEKAKYEASMNAAIEKSQPETLTKEAQAEAKAAGPPTGTAKEPVNYEEKTVPELKELARERNVEIPWDARKDEIITALEKQDKHKAKG